MNESDPSDAELAEMLSLTVSVSDLGFSVYRNHLGQRHRTLGPAVIGASGDEWWYQHDQLHRTDGPAIEYSHGGKSWYLRGERFTEQEWNERVKSL